MNKALEILNCISSEDKNRFEDMDEEDVLTFVQEAISELEEAMKPKTCDGCKTLPFVLTELAKKNGGKCGTCKRYVKDNYEAEPKGNA